MRFRLKGQVDDLPRTFLLSADGETRVGSAPTNDVVLPQAGVSRRHAVLRACEGGFEVTDLESKNGVHVNGVRTASAVLAAGDEVRFGSVSLVLDPIDEADVELALALDGRVPAARAREAAERATETWAGAEPVDALAVVEHLLGRLRGGPAALGDALTRLVEEAGLQGCCIAEVQEGSPVVVAAAGTLQAVDETRVLAAVQGAEGPDATSGVLAGAPDLVWSAMPGHPPRVALAWGGRRAASLEPVLRILVQAAAWPEAAPRRRHAAPEPPRPLVFPTHYVRGTSRPMMALYALMEPIANTGLPVLLIGETGAGKEDVARALHLSSARVGGPFVPVNCAAIPSELLEAELFGVGKGAATGVAPRTGRFQAAHGGTLFLDEIGELGLPLQAKLLRALESGEVEPLAAAPVRVDLRIVAATNVDVATRIEAGQFRADLYYRLSGAVLRIPPLRERRGDIPTLIDGILRPLAVASGKPVRGVTAKALVALVDYDWPGNVRELVHEMHRLFHGCPAGEAVEFGMLRDDIRAGPRAARRAPDGGSLELQPQVDALEGRLIQEALARSGGNRTEAAKLLGISRNGLALKITRLGLDA